MYRRGFIVSVALPLLMLAGYLAAVRIIPPARENVLFAENGIFELGTVAFFCAAGCLAIGLCVRTRREVPARYRALWLAYALAAWFVALEELSYGQHLFGWATPQWLAAHSSKNEINLHNLNGDGLSNVMRSVADVGFPVCFLVVPLVAMMRSAAYKPGRWSHYLLPRTELVTIILVAQSLTLLENLSKWLVGASLLVRPGEVQEFFWAAAAAAYVIVLWQRLLPAEVEEPAPVILKLQFETHRHRKAA
jgi:hypothetical protein